MERIETAFVLGAGLGTRLRPLTLDTPKPMLPIKNVPIIERIFDSLIDAGIKQIVVNTHHCAHKYQEYFRSPTYKGASLKFVHEEELLDTGGGLKNILTYIKNAKSLLIYNADILFYGDISKFIEDFEREENLSASLILRDLGENKNVSVKDGFVSDMRFSLKNEYEKTMQFTGIFAASETFLTAAKNYEKQKFSTVELLLNEIQKNPKSVKAYTDNSAWTDIGTPSEYQKANA